MKKILFPTDFSGASRNAFDFALYMAERLSARLLWLHVINDEKNAAKPSAIERELSKNIFFDDYQKARKENDIQIEIEPLIEDGLATESILEIAQEHEVDLIVIGSKGARKTDQGEIGGLAAYLLGHSHIPMLIIPEKAGFQSVSKMIFANDFKSTDLKGLKGLLHLAQKLDATIKCIHIRPEDQSWNRTQSSYYEQLFYFDQQTDQVNFQIRTQEHVEKAIYDAMEEKNGEVLVMLHQHRDNQEAFKAESLTRRIASIAKCLF